MVTPNPRSRTEYRKKMGNRSLSIAMLMIVILPIEGIMLKNCKSERDVKMQENDNMALPTRKYPGKANKTDQTDKRE